MDEAPPRCEQCGNTKTSGGIWLEMKLQQATGKAVTNRKYDFCSYACFMLWKPKPNI